MSDSRKVGAVLAVATTRDDGRQVLACAKAFQVSAEHDVPLADIARICDENDIKIVTCQLGCFK